HSLGVVRPVGAVGGGLALFEVDLVRAAPALRLLVPPDQLLALRPGSAFRIRRSTVVEHAPVGGPSESPTQMRAGPLGTVRLARPRLVVVIHWVDAAVEPTPAGRRAIVLKVLKARQLLLIRPGVAVDFLQDGSGGRLSAFSRDGIAEGERADRFVALQTAVRIEFFQALAQVIEKPELGPAVTRRFQDLVVPLHEAMGVGEGAALLASERSGHQEDLCPN